MEIATKIAPIALAIIMFGLGLGLETKFFTALKEGFTTRLKLLTALIAPATSFNS